MEKYGVSIRKGLVTELSQMGSVFLQPHVAFVLILLVKFISSWWRSRIMKMGNREEIGTKNGP
jgi:hypothetical protein